MSAEIQDFVRAAWDCTADKERASSRSGIPHLYRLQHTRSGIGVWPQGKPHPIPHLPVYNGDSD
jgi:hypothetical protein